MKRCMDRLMIAGLAAMTLCASLFATAGTLVSNPIVVAVRHRDCSKAVRELNSGVESQDSQTALFLGGRMLDEGICVKKDADAATEFFARSTAMGDPNAALDYAAKIGLGEGAPQDYLRAGAICRTAGVDPRSRLSLYSLGYACTVRGIAGRMLRETLPKGAFQIPTAPAIVEFSPASSQMRILSAPKAELAEGRTGSFVRAPLVNTRQVIENAWRSALESVPKPDTANLGSELVEFSLDIDMTLEAGLEATPNSQDISHMLPGDIHSNLPSIGATGQH
jgi:hypothetical protein